MNDFIDTQDMRRRGGGMRGGGMGRGGHGHNHGHGYGRSHGDRGGHMARSERVLAMPELRLLLLSLLGDDERHGYDLIRQIKALTAGQYAPSPGMVYPALTELANAGMISRASDGARKPFSITEAGKAEIASSAEALGTILSRLEALGTAASEHDTSIRRAMTNLDQVLGNIPADPASDRIDVIVELIDHTAREIERLARPGGAETNNNLER